MKASRVLASVAAVGVLVATLGSVAVNSQMHQARRSDAEIALALVVVLVPLAVGLALILRTKAGLIGWLQIATATSIAHMLLVSQIPIFLILELGHDGFWPRLAAAVPSWITFYASLATLAVIFPDGRLPSRRWRPVVLPSAVAYLAGFVAITISDHPFVDRLETHLGPFEGVFPEWLPTSLFWLAWPLMLMALAVGAAAVVVRFRRSTGIERLQLKWLAYAMSFVPLTLAVCVALGLLTPVFANESSSNLLFMALLAACALGPSAAITIAITRHGLYAIDRLINWTLVYVVLTLLLGMVWAATAAVLGVALGRGSVWSTAGATLLAAVAFGPARGRIQQSVEWQFDRARYEGLRKVRAFEDAFREGRSQPEDIIRVLRQALRDPGAELQFRQAPERLGELEARPADDCPEPTRATTTITRKGQEVAVLLHDRRLLERPYLLGSILEAANLSIEIARLQLEVRLQLSEVERSRARIVEAGDEERRRLERDLHDGAQQRLVSLGIALRRTERALPANGHIRTSLNDAVEEVARAITDLRNIAAGLRPPRLDDGLAAALSDLARRSPVPVELDVTEERLPLAIEAAAYYIACEAFTNAAKHASASQVWISATRVNDVLRLIVADDGIGGAERGAGTGLVSLADRVGANRGSFQLLSPRGVGTRVEVELPCGA